MTGSSHCTLVPYWAARLGKNGTRSPADFPPRRRALLRACRRSRQHRRARGALFGRTNDAIARAAPSHSYVVRALVNSIFSSCGPDALVCREPCAIGTLSAPQVVRRACFGRTAARRSLRLTDRRSVFAARIVPDRRNNPAARRFDRRLARRRCLAGGFSTGAASCRGTRAADAEIP